MGSKDASATSDIWGTILKDASTTRATPSVNVLVLGAPQCGKSTILSAIGHQDAAHQQMDPLDAMSGLAMSYSYAEVYDDDSEESVATVGLHELADTEFAPLLRFALNEKTLSTSAVVVCLDWSKPWDFMVNLERYLVILQKELASIVTADHQKKLETAFREYKEPSLSGNVIRFNATTLDANMAAHSVTLPLGQGVLTTNLGIPIIVVCCKADSMVSLEREHGYGDGTFDYIQQSLRTICLKYGASLFYTSIFKPKSIGILRSYILHQLLRNTELASTFPFEHRAEVIDRENVRVPSGWDNWGLIKVQGGGFSCEAMAGWDSGTDSTANGDVSSLALGRALYESEIKDPGSHKKRVQKPMITADEEQVFLERNAEVLGATSPQNGGASGAPSPYSTHSESFMDKLNQTTNFGISSTTTSINSSSVLDDVNQKMAKLQKLKEQSATAAARNKSPDSSFSGTASISSPTPLSNTSFLSATGANGIATSTGTTSMAKPAMSTNEVSNFFQSLLNKKGAGAAGASPLQAKSSSLVTSKAASGVGTTAAESVANSEAKAVAGIEEDGRE